MGRYFGGRWRSGEFGGGWFFGGGPPPDVPPRPPEGGVRLIESSGNLFHVQRDVLPLQGVGGWASGGPPQKITLFCRFQNRPKIRIFTPMKTLLALLTLALATTLLPAQPSIQWQKTYGGNSYDEAFSIKQTSDGGYIVAGSSASSTGDVVGHLGGDDFWVLKLDNNGTVEWKNVLGGTGNEIARSIQQTADGGYFVAGYTESDDHDVSGNHGGFYDGWVVKLSSTGTIEWQKALGGGGRDELLSAQQTSDNGYILAGRSNSSDGDVTENQGYLDFWVVKLDEMGALQWQKSLGGSYDDTAYTIKQSADGGYIAVGETSSTDGDVTGLHGNFDFWVVKISSEGALEWQKTLGGLYWDVGYGVIQTSDGGYAVSGYVSSDDGNVTGFHGMFDYWVAKLSSTGELEWQKALGGSEIDQARNIVPSGDGGYIIMGGTQSSNGDVIGNNGGAEYWIVKLDSVGQLVWQQTYGGSMADLGFAICNTSDNGFALAGYAWSANSGDLVGSINQGKTDFWIVKLAPESVSSAETPDAFAAHLGVFPNPAHQAITLQLPSEENDLDVRISNLLGQVVLQQNASNGGQLDIAAFPNGLYLVAATTLDGKVFWGKVEKR
jgi:hypothetical protein